MPKNGEPRRAGISRERASTRVAKALSRSPRRALDPLALGEFAIGECENLKWDEVDAQGTCIALGETKTGPSLRPLSRAAFAVIEKQDPIADFVFPAGPEADGYQGLPGLWRTVQITARATAEAAAAERGEPAPKAGPLDGVTLHSLRHSRFGLDALPANPRNRRAIIIGGSPPIWELLEARARRDRRSSNFASSPKSAV